MFSGAVAPDLGMARRLYWYVENTQSISLQVESSKSSTPGRCKVDRAMDAKRREIASMVASLRAEGGHELTISRRCSRNRTSERAGIGGCGFTIAIYISATLGNLRADLTFPPGVPIRRQRYERFNDRNTRTTSCPEAGAGALGIGQVTAVSTGGRPIDATSGSRRAGH